MPTAPCPHISFRSRATNCFTDTPNTIWRLVSEKEVPSVPNQPNSEARKQTCSKCVISVAKPPVTVLCLQGRGDIRSPIRSREVTRPLRTHCPRTDQFLVPENDRGKRKAQTSPRHLRHSESADRVEPDSSVAIRYRFNPRRSVGLTRTHFHAPYFGYFPIGRMGSITMRSPQLGELGRCIP